MHLASWGLNLILCIINFVCSWKNATDCFGFDVLLFFSLFPLSKTKEQSHCTQPTASLWLTWVPPGSAKRRIGFSGSHTRAPGCWSDLGLLRCGIKLMKHLQPFTVPKFTTNLSICGRVITQGLSFIEVFIGISLWFANSCIPSKCEPWIFVRSHLPIQVLKCYLLF